MTKTDMTTEEIMDALTVSADTVPFDLQFPPTEKYPEGRTLTLDVKELTWTDQSDAFGKSFVITLKDGQPVMEYQPTTFRIEILKKRLIKPPFPLTEVVLRQIRPEVGAQLDALVPDPFSKMVEAQGLPKD